MIQPKVVEDNPKMECHKHSHESRVARACTKCGVELDKIVVGRCPGFKGHKDVYLKSEHREGPPR